MKEIMPTKYILECPVDIQQMLAIMNESSKSDKVGWSWLVAWGHLLLKMLLDDLEP